MKTNPPHRTLREQPDLEQLKRQAKELLRTFRAASPEAVAEVRAHYRRADAAAFALHDAQLVLARSYGFESWPKLKAYVDGVTVKRLAEAVSAGDIKRARAMLKARPELADMALAYADERRPLHFAVLRGDAPMVRLLMQHGASARKGVHPFREATTALTMASERGHDEIVAVIQEEERQPRRRREAEDTPVREELTEADRAARAAVVRGDAEWLRVRHREDALVNTIDLREGGLLTVAVTHDRPDMLALLLELGLDPNERVRLPGDGPAPVYSQALPLWRCAARGRLDMAEILLAGGADPNAQVDSSGSSVFSAYSHRQWEMVELLRRHGGVLGADTVALYRETELAREMLASPADRSWPEGTISPGRTLAEDLLRYGSSGGALEIVQMALERVDWAPDDRRWTEILTEPLYFWNHIPWLSVGNHDLDRGGYFACFRLILERCGPRLTGSFGRTALHEVAAMRDHVTAAEAAPFAAALLDAGARTDVRDHLLASTPLGWACRWGRPEVAALLLERGADPVEADAAPWATPRAWARKRGDEGLLALLAKHGG
jgi:ankyrin repeat protein